MPPIRYFTVENFAHTIHDVHQHEEGIVVIQLPKVPFRSRYGISHLAGFFTVKVPWPGCVNVPHSNFARLVTVAEESIA